MNLAVLLLSVSNAPRVTTITRDDVHRLITHMAGFVFDQSGEQELLQFRVFEWCQLSMTLQEWGNYGFNVGDKVVPEVERTLLVDLSSYDHFALVIDVPQASGGAWAPGRKYLHIAAASLMPTLLGHEIGHLYGANHANLDTPAGPQEYGDQFCVMGGNQFSFANADFNSLPDGPGMCAPTLTACGWLNVGLPNVGVDVGPSLRSRPGETVINLRALDGAPKQGWGGPPVVAWADGLHGQRLYVEYRSPNTFYDQGLQGRGAQVGPLGSIVVHLATGARPNVSVLKIAAFPVVPDANFFLEHVGVQVTVTTVYEARRTVQLRLKSVPQHPYLGQANWRFCVKCFTMFYDGYSMKGVCLGDPRKGEHLAMGYNFVLPHNVPGTPTAQTDWEFCTKCNGMFYNGYPDKGKCPADGGGHQNHPDAFRFVLPHNVPGTPTAQTGWEFCIKCHEMFYDGYSEKGKCPADSGGHQKHPEAYRFVLPHRNI